MSTIDLAKKDIKKLEIIEHYPIELPNDLTKALLFLASDKREVKDKINEIIEVLNNSR